MTHSPTSPEHPPHADALPDARRFVHDAYWILAGRAASPLELRDETRQLDAHAKHVLLMRLTASPEFIRVRRAWLADQEPYPDPAAVERGLSAIGTPEVFVARVYETLLGRAADGAGLAHYADALGRGDSRRQVIKAIGLSQEFEDRFRAVVPQGCAPLRDVQLCELANPAKWENEEWLEILRSLGLSDDKLSMHRKPYEFTQLIFGSRRLGALRDDADVISVGAGHELVLYWLANQVQRVVATDMYEGVWQDVQGREGDPDVIRRPEDYAPFPYRKDHLVFLKMDGRQLAFQDATFDLAYSLSSIEHFGGMEGAAATIREMGRVLKPGGILALATEFVLSGPPHEETFQPEEFYQLIDQPGLELVEPVDDRVYRRYDYRAVDLYANPYQTPHMVVRFDDTVFTTVMVFLRKR
ncbi:MAG: methyltransferase domain-containing protein [Vicinamibacterales bacterium]